MKKIIKGKKGVSFLAKLAAILIFMMIVLVIVLAIFTDTFTKFEVVINNAGSCEGGVVVIGTTECQQTCKDGWLDVSLVVPNNNCEEGYSCCVKELK